MSFSNCRMMVERAPPRRPRIAPGEHPPLSRLHQQQQQRSHKTKDKSKRQTVNEKTVSLEKLIESLNSPFHSHDYASKRQQINTICTNIAGSSPRFFEDTNTIRLICERISPFLSDEQPAIRTVAMRVLRKSLYTFDALESFVSFDFTSYVVRALDLSPDSELESEEAYKLAAQFLRIAATKTPPPPAIYAAMQAMLRSIDAIVLHGLERGLEAETLSLPCLAVTMELCIVCPQLVLEIMGIEWITMALLKPGICNRQITELVCQIIVYWLDSPYLRENIKIRKLLEMIFAPLFLLESTELGNPLSLENLKHSSLHVCVELTFGLLRSWTGLISCSATGNNKSPTFLSSPLRLLAFLVGEKNATPNLAKLAELTVTMLCDLFYLPYGHRKLWNWNNAIAYYGEMRRVDAFSSTLQEDFVLAEYEAMMNVPSTTNRIGDNVDFIEAYFEHALCAIAESGIFESLVQLIVGDPDDPIALTATLLFWHLNEKASSVLSDDWEYRLTCLPKLVNAACEAVLNKESATVVDCRNETDAGTKSQTSAKNSLILLKRLDELNSLNLLQTSSNPITDVTSNWSLFVQKSRPPVSVRMPVWDRGDSGGIPLLLVSSKETSGVKHYLSFWMQYGNEAASHFPLIDIDGFVFHLIGEAVGVDATPKWTAVDAVLRVFEGDLAFFTRYRNNDRCRLFFSQLIYCFSPHRDAIFLAQFQGQSFVAAIGCRIVGLLLKASEEEFYHQLLTEFINECVTQLSPNNLRNGVFAASNLVKTGAMYCFAIIGTISASASGVKLLESAGLLQLFLDLMTETTHAELVKLIVCSLDYSESGLARIILQKALGATKQPCRSFATRFLDVLASLRLPQFGQWGLQLLVQQLADKSSKIVNHAIAILHRRLPSYAEHFDAICVAKLEMLGDAGVLLQSHLCGSEEFVKNNLEIVGKMVQMWNENFAFRFVDIFEEQIRSRLAKLKRSSSGYFARKSSARKAPRSSKKPPLPHLFGQLANHRCGAAIITNANLIDRQTTIVLSPSYETVDDCQRVKAALLTLGHIGQSDTGFGLLNEACVNGIRKLANECPYLSIRGIARWCLDLLHQTVPESENDENRVSSLDDHEFFQQAATLNIAQKKAEKSLLKMLAKNPQYVTPAFYAEMQRLLRLQKLSRSNRRLLQDIFWKF